MRTTSLALVLLPALALAPACRRGPEEPSPAHTESTASRGPADPHTHGATPSGAMPAAPPIAPASALTWTDPPGWHREQPASPMRRAQYRIDRAPGDPADAELVVITFGGGQGGSVEQNLSRWYAQVQQPDGGDTRAVATRAQFVANGMNVTLTEAPGRLGGGAAMPGLPPSPVIEHGRLLAAIVETPAGPWFFKITGPDATVTAARPAFEAMLHTLDVAPAH